MPNTTNFNWSTPADTDLVKDGASAIRTLGNSIDTSFVDLKGGTSGQVLSKASGTDLDFSWVSAASGSMTLLSTTTLSGTTTTISTINQSYKDLYFVAYGVVINGSGNFRVAPNGDTTVSKLSQVSNSLVDNYTDYMYLSGGSGVPDSGGANVFAVTIEGYSVTTYRKPFNKTVGYVSGGNSVSNIGGGYVNLTAAISSLVFSTSATGFTSGTVLVYGVN
jgi:hypothetical protein